MRVLVVEICKSIVGAHHGTIDFESQERIGTAFRVLLPYGTKSGE